MSKWIFGILFFVLKCYGRYSLNLKVKLYRKLGAKIGVGVRLYGKIDGVNPHLVKIGDYTVIGEGSFLAAHCPVRGPRPVTIGNYVWMGFGVTVLPGVSIGDGCIIGAGSVVTKDISPYSIVAGNPARVIRERSHDEFKQTVALLKDGKPIGKG